MKNFKVGVKAFTDIEFYGNQTMTCKDYWTTVCAENESQAKVLAHKNLSIQIAQNEFFACFNVKYWKGIYIDKADMVIGE